MKILSIAIPSYNSEAYLSKCVESLLPGGEDVEILIVDDGSKDNTAKIADEYEAKYPGIVKAIHQENGGHGEAVNTGIKNATGLYFKVVDSDDWVKESAYMEILSKLKELLKDGQAIDMMVSNFVYEKEGAKHKKVMKYKHALPLNTVFSWSEVGHFHKGQYMLMHSIIFRTKLLKECGLELPKHTFYVDNLYVFWPLPYVEKIYYMDVNFYRYYIGREDQSVNEKVMIGRIDQQIKVNKLMVDYMVDINPKIKYKKVTRYMLNYLEIITVVSSIMLIIENTPQSLAKKKELWTYIKNKDSNLYRRLRYGALGNSMNLPGRGGRKVSVEGYKIARRFFKFN